MQLDDVVNNVLQFCADIAQEKQIQLVCNIHKMTIDANQRLLEQALKNLVENAIKYSKNQTKITISTTMDDHTLSIHVQDEGPGIAAEHMDQLFQRFYRIDSARSREMGGTGLGLAIVKHIAIAHSGWTSVTSQVGCGSTFSIHIPRLKALLPG